MNRLVTPGTSRPPTPMLLRTLLLLLIVLIINACAGSPSATARYYLSDKPAEDRVPVSGQTDPAAAEIQLE